MQHFSKKSSSKLGYSTRCKECCAKAHKAWYMKNRNDQLKKMRAAEVNRRNDPAWIEKLKSKSKADYANNKERHSEIMRCNYLLKKAEYRKRNDAYRTQNKEQVTEWSRLWSTQRRKEDVNFRLRKTLRGRLKAAIKNNQKTGSAVRDLGCSVEELKIYLESKFQPGMTWENWSLHGWHIDHIIPLSLFNLSDRDQLRKACHYTNLQPLWAKDNLSKGATVETSSYISKWLFLKEKTKIELDKNEQNSESKQLQDEESRE